MCIFKCIFSKCYFIDDVIIIIRFHIRTRISITLLKCVTNNSYWWNIFSILYYAPEFIAAIFKLRET